MNTEKEFDIEKLLEIRNQKVKNDRMKLIHISRVKRYIKENKCEISAEAIEMINQKVYELINEAIYRTRSNKRITIRPYDF